MKPFKLLYGKALGCILAYNMIAFFIAMYLLLSDTGYSTYDSELIFMVAVNVFFISIVSSVLIIKVAQRSKTEMQYQLALQQMELETQANEDLDKMMNKMRSFRHDINNHFSVMKGLLQQQQHEDLERYLSDITNDMSSMNQMVLLENKALTALINNKMIKAYMNSIELQTTILVADHPLSDLDLCGILGNIIDNAIEASLSVEENPLITLSITSKGSLYRISCSNPYTTEPVQNGGVFMTSKQNKKLHGFGIENIRQIANKYDGDVLIDYGNQVFTMDVVIQA